MEYCAVGRQSTIHHARHAQLPSTTVTATTAGRTPTTAGGIPTTTTMATESGMAKKKHVTCRGV